MSAMVNIIGNNNSIFNQIISEIRDQEIQKDSMRFRFNLERLGEIFAYELSKKLEYKEKEVQTSLGVAKVPVLVEQPVLATILRAGLPLHNGLLRSFDRADNAYISAFRKHTADGFEIELQYVSSPNLDDRILIISDPMLATGKSMLIAIKELFEHGKPKHIHIVSVLAANDGLEYIKSNLACYDVTIWLGAVDAELTAQSYIVPGLGDAGDLAYGEKE